MSENSNSEGVRRVAEILLDNGADVNARGHCGRTALLRAVSRNAVETAKLLLERGADAHLSDIIGNSPHIVARERGYQEILSLMDSAAMVQKTAE
mmetsp:Transcript_50686/g.99696  ORF Transcript_50686/g.99696 Transcript_50686/m.99696 type:complete len:95 (+) Transcript_50686:489-773(+)